MASISVGRLVVSVAADLSKLQAGLKRSRTSLQKWSVNLGKLGMSLTRRLTAPLALVGVAAVKMAADFDKAMVQSTAIMGDLSEEMRGKLEANARAIGKTTTFSAKEAAAAYRFLAMAGLNAEQTLASLRPAANLAAAAQMDLQRATDLVTDAQTAMGLSSKNTTVHLANFTRISDVLVKGSTLANATVEQLAESVLNKAGPAMRSLGMSIEETVALFAGYASQGKKAEEAGTLLTMLVNGLQKSVQDNAAGWEDLGIKVHDGAGEMRKVVDIMGDLERKMQGMSDKERYATKTKIGFNLKTMQSIDVLMGVTDAVKDFETGLWSANGATKEIAEKQLKNFSDQVTLLWHNIQDLAIGLGKALLPTFQKTVKWLQDSTAWFAKLAPGVKQAAVVFGVLAAALGPLLIVISQLLPLMPLLAASATGLGAALLLLAGNPTTWVVAGITALIAVLAHFDRGAAGAADATKGYATKLEELEAQAKRTGDALQKALDLKTGVKARIDEIKRNIAELEAASSGPRSVGGMRNFGKERAIKELKQELQWMEKGVGAIAKTTVLMAEQAAAKDRLTVADEKRNVALGEATKAYGANGDALELVNDKLLAWEQYQKAILPLVEAGNPLLQKSGERIRELREEIQELIRAETAGEAPTVAIAEAMEETSELALLAAKGFEELAAKARRLEDIKAQIAAVRDQMQGFAVEDIANAKLMFAEWSEGLQLQLQDIAGGFIDVFETFTDGFANAMASAIVYGENFRDAMANVTKQVLGLIVQMLIKLGIQQLLYAIISVAAEATKTTAAITAAAAITFAAAYAASIGPLTAMLLFAGPAAAAALAQGAVTTMLAGSVAAGAAGKAAGAGLFTAMAEGGIVRQPTLALIGEAGPEAVIPLSGGMPGGSTVVILEADGRTLAKIVAPHLGDVLKKRIGGRTI